MNRFYHDKIHEECGVFGIFANDTTNVAHHAYIALHALQHRGQEGCGIAVNNWGVFKYYKDLGLVNEVFTQDVLKDLGNGNIAVGHVRYSTSGSNNRINCQPIVVKHMKGSLALAHNGNLINSSMLRHDFELKGSIFQTTSDTEVISYTITQERLKSASIEEAVNKAMNIIKGAYSLILMSPAKLIAVRDEYGFRPLCYGMMEDGSYVVVSETCALDALGAKFIREIEPGEIVVFTEEGVHSIKDHCNKQRQCFCIFEYIYFARPDSIIGNTSVHEARLRAGKYLAIEHPVDADIVIGVPDSGIDGAIGYAQESKIPYGIGLIKSRYVARTFITPEQKTREEKVKMKLNPVVPIIRNKKIVLIDDSIVRGTTSAIIVKLLRQAGAKEIHLRVTSPKFIDVCYYGTDIDSKECLIANNHSVEDIARIIGADSVGFLSVENVVKIPGCSNCNNYCTSCFTGNYYTDIPTIGKKDCFEEQIPRKRKVNYES